MTLRDYQEKALEDLRNALRGGEKRILHTAPTGCHAPGQQVLMYDGSLKAVEDVRQGDLLMGPDSTTRTVTGLCSGRGKMHRITPVKGRPFVVNEGHVLSLVRTNDGWNKAHTLRDVTVKEWLTWSRTHKHIHKLFRVAVEFSPGHPLPISPYFLGVLLGDGYISSGSTGVITADAEIEEERNQVLQRQHLIKDQSSTQVDERDRAQR